MLSDTSLLHLFAKYVLGGSRRALGWGRVGEAMGLGGA
jgi:hypothetical protein